MRTIVFVHQNMPGQFKFLARWFGGQNGWRTVFITKRNDRELPGVRRLIYTLHREPSRAIHPYLGSAESAVLYGQAVARKLIALRDQGITPDLIVGHSGWGETLYCKDVFPNTPLLTYSEFFYRAKGGDMDFDPNAPPSLDAQMRARTRNSVFLISLEAADAVWCASEWQRSVHPREYDPLIKVIHEGIDTTLFKPDPEITFTLPNGRVLTCQDEVVTYVARNLEPYRGFPTFMRALPRLLERRPEATVLVVGAEGISYGAKPEGYDTWRACMEAEVDFDRSRVHFLGGLMYGDYRRVLQISSAHIYLTYPFVLSWSMLEAMSAGCLIVASRTAPVQEVMEDGVNGLLVDFFSPDEVADRVVAALADPDAFASVRAAARKTIQDRYDLRLCFDKQLDMIRRLIRP